MQLTDPGQQRRQVVQARDVQAQPAAHRRVQAQAAFHPGVHFALVGHHQIQLLIETVVVQVAGERRLLEHQGQRRLGADEAGGGVFQAQRPLAPGPVDAAAEGGVGAQAAVQFDAVAEPGIGQRQGQVADFQISVDAAIGGVVARQA